MKKRIHPAPVIALIVILILAAYSEDEPPALSIYEQIAHIKTP